MSKVIYKASCWDCQDFYIGKTKRRLHDRKTEHFKAITSKSHASAIADHVTSTGHNLKWDHFDILARGRSDIHCKIKETLLIRDLVKHTNIAHLGVPISPPPSLGLGSTVKFPSAFYNLTLNARGAGLIFSYKNNREIAPHRVL